MSTGAGRAGSVSIEGLGVIMYRWFTVLILGLVLSTTAGATETVAMDGVWWTAQNEKTAPIKSAATVLRSFERAPGYRGTLAIRARREIGAAPQPRYS